MLDEGIGNALFEVADAQTFRHDVPFDAIISRFGVMFFDDPVAAFANLHGGLWTGGRIAFACWQDLLLNEWITVAGGALLEHVPPTDPQPTDVPGPFAFSDQERVRGILSDAGFDDATFAPIEEPILLGGKGTIDDAMDFILRTSIAVSMLESATPEQRTAGIAAVRDALTPYLTGDGVRVGAAAWLVTATKG